MAKGSGGTRGGGASGGMSVSQAEKELGFSLKGMSKEDQKFWVEQAESQKKWKKDFDARVSQPRTPIQKGSDGYKEAQKMANALQEVAAGNTLESGGLMNSWNKYAPKDYSDSKKSAGEFLKFATDHIAKHGNDFEKSVAASVAKTIKTSGKGWGKVAFVSSKQAWVLGKALSETHVKMSDFPDWN